MHRYSLAVSEGGSNVTFIHDGDLLVADGDHPNFKKIVLALADEDSDPAEIALLFDIERVVRRTFSKLSERVTVRDGKVTFDNEEANGILPDAILRALDEGADLAPLVNFYDKVMQNPQADSRESLYRWLEAEDFTITPNGNILAYKGVNPVDGDDGVYESSYGGHAFVNDVEVNGKVRQSVGDVVTMPRSEVTFDPRTPCSAGLHVGTDKYARSFATTTLLVEVNPRDVVSVPTDYSNQKVRVCRYKIVSTSDGKITSLVHNGESDNASERDPWQYDEDNGEDVTGF